MLAGYVGEFYHIVVLGCLGAIQLINRIIQFIKQVIMRLKALNFIYFCNGYIDS